MKISPELFFALRVTQRLPGREPGVVVLATAWAGDSANAVTSVFYMRWDTIDKFWLDKSRKDEENGEKALTEANVGALSVKMS